MVVVIGSLLLVHNEKRARRSLSVQRAQQYHGDCRGGKGELLFASSIGGWGGRVPPSGLNRYSSSTGSKFEAEVVAGVEPCAQYRRPPRNSIIELELTVKRARQPIYWMVGIHLTQVAPISCGGAIPGLRSI
jgi:hypothetical protein